MKRTDFELLQEAYRSLYTESSLKEKLLAKFQNLSDEDMLPLPEEPETFFKMNWPGLVMLDMDKLQNIRARESGIRNALIMMYAKANNLAEGLGSRQPISVREIGDGRYEVLDGNSTFNIAKRSGWKKIPAEIVTELPEH
jgi:hypothetical protein